ncbi:MAG: transglycosylase domain-containing protein [Candidatus Binatia bacterium]
MTRAAGGVAIAALLAWWALPAAPPPPALAEVRAATCPSDARLLDRHGEVLHELRVDRHRRRLAWTPLADISPALVAATIASEDRRFRAHGGVDARALAAALWQRLRGGSPRGASTLSMQLAAILDPGLARGAAPRTLAAKWAQMRAAWALERSWSKDEILEAYLNLVGFRGELQGSPPPRCCTARRRTASPAPRRSAWPRRCAAPTPTAPRWRGAPPRWPRRSTRRSKRRRSTPRWRGRSTPRPKPAAHDAGAAPRPSAAARGQRRLPCRGHHARCRRAASRGRCRAPADGVAARARRDAAVLVADNASGDVLAYVGSSGALSAAAQVDGVRARRQAGSTLKPVLYGLAIERRLLTAATRLDDAPLEIPVAGGLFRPRNYDDVFRGPVSVRTALAGSLNVPAVRALQLVGADDFADRLRAFGFDDIRQPGGYYGPALALGSAEVTLWQLVDAYRALANGGLWSPLHLAAAGTARRRRGAPSIPPRRSWSPTSSPTATAAPSPSAWRARWRPASGPR